MTNPIVLLSLMLLPAMPVLGENAAPAAVSTAAPAAATPAPASAAAPSLAAAPAPAKPHKTLAGLERHVTRTVTALMRQIAESRIPPQARSPLNDRLLAVQAQVSAAVQAGQAPEGQDVDGFSAALGKDLDAVAGAIDAASRRAL